MIEPEGGTVISLNINGDSHEIVVRPSDLLLDILREQLGLASTKAGCRNGDCGACAVMVDGWPAKSYPVLVVEVQDKKITTVEGLDGKVAIQKAFIEANAFQCRYCTPGSLMVCHALTTRHPIMPNEIIMGEWLQSNLCRCTSYQEIREAVRLMCDSLWNADI